ncbi:MAG: cysteine desulfurase-like protein [Anaerolineae bacterium]|jgi:cysteine desulfurase family protein (TIGR01976 family)|nr:cysteine desulfurase-like protein [Anaerolineae bacterium]
MPGIDLSPLRVQFPALAIKDAGRTAVFFDGPGGTQVPQRVIDAMSHYLAHTNANHGGAFRTSRESDVVLLGAHQGMADLLNADAANEIVFGPNMTTLTFALSRAIGRELAEGDEVLITRLDHDANRAPWLALAERGIVVNEVEFDPTDCTLRLDDLAAKLNARTRVIAVGYASNAVGTINPIARIAEMAHSVGAWLWVDAVHYAPHGPIDVQALGCDFLVCSPYKFFGPHSGVVWGKYELLERLRAYKVRPAGNLPPDKFETGTQSHETQAGVLAAIDYLTELGEEFGAPFTPQFPGFSGRRLALKQALAAIQAYEQPLFEHFVAGLLAIPGLSFYGIRAFDRFDRRTPTAAFRLTGRSPQQVAEHLARRGVYVWAGNFYALAVTERLELEESGGVVRAGLAHYNTYEEVDYCLACLREIA